MLLLLQYFEFNTYLSLGLSLLTVFFGWLAVLSFLPRDFREALLSFNHDGVVLMGFGLIVLGIGLLVPDYTGAFAALTLSFTFVILGALIALPDKYTLLWISEKTRWWYTAFAMLAFGYAVQRGFSLSFYLHGLGTLVAPIGLCVFFCVLALLTLAPKATKDRILPLDSGGESMVVLSITVLALAPLAYPSGAVIASVAALGATMFALGSLVASKEQLTEYMLQKNFVPLEIGIAVLCSYVARIGF